MTRLIDLLEILPRHEVEIYLRRLASAILRAADFISSERKRTDRSVALVNFLRTTAAYTKELSRSLDAHISISATCTRSLYEVNLHVRDVLGSEDGIIRWQSEAVTDKLQLLEGILATSSAPENDPRRVILLVEIQRLKELRSRYKLTDSKPAMAYAIAKKTGMGDDHEALYKIFSKLTHPTSYLVNSYAEASSEETRIVLLARAQLAALDTWTRVGEDMSVPDELLEPPPLDTSKKRRRKA